jgi:hypothetical protein
MTCAASGAIPSAKEICLVGRQQSQRLVTAVRFDERPAEHDAEEHESAREIARAGPHAG